MDLVGLPTHCNMMHGAYNVKLLKVLPNVVQLNSASNHIVRCRAPHAATVSCDHYAAVRECASEVKYCIAATRRVMTSPSISSEASV